MHEPINVRAIKHFLGYSEARTLCDGNGNYVFRSLSTLLDRAHTDGNKGHYIVVILTRQPYKEGLIPRAQSGMGRIPYIPNLAVSVAFGDELQKKVPRGKMGGSAFAYDRLVKLVARHGLRGCDFDMRRAFLQLRVRYLSDTLGADVVKGLIPLHIAYVANPLDVPYPDDAPADRFKALIIGISNGKGIDDEIRELQVHTAFWTWLMSFRAEAVEVRRLQLKHAKCEDLAGGALTWQSHIDEHLESVAMAALKVDAPSDYPAVDEWDGVVIFERRGESKVVSDWVAARSGGYDFALKNQSYEDCLKERHPDFTFLCAKCPTHIWLHEYGRCVKLLGDDPQCRSHDTVFASVVAGLRDSGFAKIGGALEYWDGQVWHKNQNPEDLEETVKKDLRGLFCTFRKDEFGDIIWSDPGTPLEADE